MSKTDEQGVCIDEKGQEQPKDKEAAQKKGQPSKKVKDDELQPLREKSGF